MTLKLQNNIIVPTPPDAFRPTAQLKDMGDSTNVAIYVATRADRDALTPVKGMVCIRGDLTGSPLQTYDGTTWGASDTAWTTLPMAAGFNHEIGSNWSGLRYRIKDDVMMVNGAVTRVASWPAGQVFSTVNDATLRPANRIQGSNCQMDSGGNLIFDAAGSGSRSVAVAWPLG